MPVRDLIFRNGFGGFTPDGKEYVITLQPGQNTPAPWVNVLANPTFGTVVSESGAAYTWGENSHEFRLTPWSDDPVQDTTGEAIYIRDEQTGQYWSPTPFPPGRHPLRHPPWIRLHRFRTHRKRYRLRVVGICRPGSVGQIHRLESAQRLRTAAPIVCHGLLGMDVGELRQKGLLHVQTEVDVRTGALLARNYYNSEFGDRIAFLDVNEAARTVTGDRKEFIGRNGSLAQPEAMRRSRLSGKVGGVSTRAARFRSRSICWRDRSAK